MAEKLASASNALGFSLIKEILKDDKIKASSTIISPLYLSLSIALAAQGASGETHKELLEATGLKDISVSQIRELVE